MCVSEINILPLDTSTSQRFDEPHKKDVTIGSSYLFICLPLTPHTQTHTSTYKLRFGGFGVTQGQEAFFLLLSLNEEQKQLLL